MVSMTQKQKVSRLIGVPSGFILEGYPKQLGPEDLKFSPQWKEMSIFRRSKIEMFCTIF